MAWGKRVIPALLIAGAAAFAGGAAVPRAHAQAPAVRLETQVDGAYSNLIFQIREAGSTEWPRSGRSPLMPWLYLLEDFTYEWGRDRGTYRVQQDDVLLSGAYKAWGPGRVDRDRRITFRFSRIDANGRKQELAVVMAYRGSLKDYPSPSRR
jgi:hypothetical protein